nr:MAG TPA: hypothetical protein [Caudoviricetes sp.]
MAALRQIKRCEKQILLNRFKISGLISLKVELI